MIPCQQVYTSAKWKAPSNADSTLVKLLWINLDRRPDRASRQRNSIEASGLGVFAERVSAVDGRQLDLSKVPSSILTEEGRHQALNPPDFVLGRILTPGAIGLWLTWYQILTKIRNEGSAEECFLVVEDDSEYCTGFDISLFKCLEVLDLIDRGWHACAVGFIRSKTKIVQLPWEAIGTEVDPHFVEYVNHCIGLPAKLCGAAAILVHGAEGAASLLDALFPVGPDSQFDRKISDAIYSWQGRLRMYISATPLIAAPLSETGDTDIQSIPESMLPELQREAEYRHKMGDVVNASHSELSNMLGSAPLSCQMLEELDARVDKKHLGVEKRVAMCHMIHAAQQGTKCVRWTAKRPCISQDVIERSKLLKRLRKLDCGVPFVRKLCCNASMLLNEMETLEHSSRARHDIERQLQAVYQQFEDAVHVRKTILKDALENISGRQVTSQKRIVLGTVDGRTIRPRGHFKKVLIMGLYHSCTNAIAKELEKRFEVTVANDWHTDKCGVYWKHRVNEEPLQGLDDDCLILLMVKEPHFWLKSCSREVRNFFEIHPFAEDQHGNREDVPAERLEQLFGPLEHDAILYEHAVELWNATVQSYFNDKVYSPCQAAIVRSEDFLFKFHAVLDELASYGLSENASSETHPQPSNERAKGHKECRTRDEALSFYGNLANLQSGFELAQLELISRDLDPEALCRLCYDGDNPVSSWTSLCSLILLSGVWQYHIVLHHRIDAAHLLSVYITESIRRTVVHLD